MKPLNPPAFPMGNPEQGGYDGMTLRDWFAGQTLAGLMSNQNIPFAADYAECEPEQIAKAVFDIADAMLAQREQG